MDLQIVIDSVDRSDLIDWRSISKSDYETSRVDTFSFVYLKYGSRTWTPQIEDTIEVTDADTATVIFAGRIIAVNPVLNKNFTVEYEIQCKDWTVDFDDELVAHTYENETVEDIINDILPAGFTDAGVNCTTTVERIQFNYQTKSAVLATLAALVGYHWYIDYAKDVHFFPKLTDAAPFRVTDNSEHLIAGSLSIDKNNSQLRNSIYILGGETVGNSRTESYVADGDQDHFPLANKFSNLPVVKDNTVAKAVGVAPLQTFAQGPYDVLWNFNEKYIQFDVIPTAGHQIDIVGTPLAQIAVKIEDPISITTYGRREFRIEDKTIKDTLTARKRGVAELEAYAHGIVEGQFRTYTDGLRSGQYIRVTSGALDIDEDYMIKSVSMKMHTHSQAIYSVSLVSKKTVGIIELLTGLLKMSDKINAPAENATITIVKAPSEIVNVAEDITVVAEEVDHRTIDIDETVRRDPWGAGVITPVFAPYFPVDDADPKRPARFDRAEFS